MPARRPCVLAVSLLLVAGCSGGDDSTGATIGDDAASATTDDATVTTVQADNATSATSSTTTIAAPTTTVADVTRADDATVEAIELAIGFQPAGCDPLDPRQCLLPFPSDAYTVADPSTPTGRRVAIPDAGLPSNAEGIVVDPTEWNRNDGFSANASLLTHMAGLDAEASDLPPWTDLEASLDADSTVVLLDTSTGERVPLWAEPDAQADDDADRLLVIHPAISLAPATTYAVAIRGLVDRDGDPIEPSPAFRVYRDAEATDLEPIEARRDAMEDLFATLATAGIRRPDLQLAWTFTTASTESVTSRLVHARDAALAGLNGSAPPFVITAVTPSPADGIDRLVEGTFTVANFLTRDGSPGNRFVYATAAPGPNDLPVQNGTSEAQFACMIPTTTAISAEPARLVQYGHGLLGSQLEIAAADVVAMGNEHRAVYCATKWAGMSDDDIGQAVASLQDLSSFPAMVDRMQQGMVNQIVLGRLMLSADGLVTDPNFQRAGGAPIVDTSALYFDGNSQGGIMGMALAAVSTDFERAVLGVVGMNYSTLLPRSVDFDAYEQVFVPAYDNDLERELLLSVIQMLWDRGEGAGYVRHVVADPLPSTPPKRVLMHVAFGDWQVSELTAMVAARTMGVPIHRPVTAPDRSGEIEPGWDIDTLGYPGADSALVIWDSGSDPIPFEQLAPRTSRDPHGDPRNDVDVRLQKAAFLFDGQIVDVCNAGPCTADPR